MQLLTDLAALLGFETGSSANILPPSITPQVLTGSVQGNSLSMGNYEIATAAIVDVGAIAAGLTAGFVQVEEWNGTTANGSTWTAISGEWFTAAGNSTANPQSAATNGRYCFLGLRTQGYCRVNAITYAGTTVSAVMDATILGMIRSESSGGGFTRSPST